MAVYEHTYKPFEGRLTAQWSRFMVIPRHANRAVFKSKLFTGLFALCFVCPLVMAIIIYLRHNVNALALMGVQSADIVPIDGNFFRIFMMIQSSLAFLLTVLIGPVLVSRDLTNNALPLYLCRPFSRFEYVLGKASVLVFMLSLITWVPGMLLFTFESYLDGLSWLTQNAWIAGAILISSAIWVGILTLFSLALSAWIKWRVAASGALFAVFTIPTAIAAMIGELFHTPWSHLFSPSMLVKVVTDDLFRYATSNDLDSWTVLPVWAGWMGLAGVVALSLGLLSRKVRAYEVIT